MPRTPRFSAADTSERRQLAEGAVQANSGHAVAHQHIGGVRRLFQIDGFPGGAVDHDVGADRGRHIGYDTFAPQERYETAQMFAALDCELQKKYPHKTALEAAASGRSPLVAAQ